MVKKKSGGDLIENFVQTILGSSSANSAPVGVSNLNAASVIGGGTRKGRSQVKAKPAAKPSAKPSSKLVAKKAKPAAKTAAKKAKPVAKKAKPAAKPIAKTALSNKHLVTRGGMNATPIITALLALGLRIANGDSLTSTKKTKGGGTNKRGGAPSLEHFVQSLQLGGSEDLQNGSGTPFAFNSDGVANTSMYDPSSLANASSLTTQKYDDILSNTAVYKAPDSVTNQYLSSASARSATTGGSRKKRSTRSKSPVRKSSSAKKSKPATRRKRRGGADTPPEPEEAARQAEVTEAESAESGEQDGEQDGAQDGAQGGPQGGGRGRKRSPRKPVTKRSKSPAKKAKKARSKSPVRVQRRTRGRRGGNGNCSREASDLII